MVIEGSIYFVDISTPHYPRCSFFIARNNRFLEHGPFGQQGFTCEEELDNMRCEYMAALEEDIQQIIKRLVPEGFWERV